MRSTCVVMLVAALTIVLGGVSPTRAQAALAASLVSTQSVEQASSPTSNRASKQTTEQVTPTPSIMETLAAVGKIARELKLIDAQLAKLTQSLASVDASLTSVGTIAQDLKAMDARLSKLEQSLAGIDASLKPVGAIAQPSAVRELILLVSVCAAGLIVLHALLRRWAHRADRPVETNK